MDISYWSVNFLSRRDWGIVNLASCEFHFIRVYENVFQRPSNDVSIKDYRYPLVIDNYSGSSISKCLFLRFFDYLGIFECCLPCF